MSYLGRSAKLSLKAQEKVSFLATAGQTVKTGLSYTPSFVEVYVNGVLLTDTTDYTATNGNSITFTVALLLNDEVTVISLKTFTVADHYTKSDADTLLAAKATNTALALKAPIASPSFTGPVGVDGNNAYTAKTRFTYGSSAPTYFSDWGYKSSSDGNKVFLTITDGGSAKDVLVADFRGNVGVGVAPETDWNAVWSVAQVGNSALASTSGNNQMSLSQNAKLTSTSSNSGAKYIETEQASQYVQENGNHHFKVAPSGSADAAISFTNAMTIDNSGNVYIPTGNLRVTNLVITTKQIDLTTSLQDLIQVGNRASYKITVSVGDGSGGGVSGFNTAYVTCSNDTATQGNITQRVGGTVVLSWKAANGTSSDAHTLQARVTSGSANQCTIMVETLSRYASAGSGTGNGQSSIQL
jgi:hypothetical protein